MDKTQKVPLFPLGVVLLPEMSLPLHIFEERYKQMISECLNENRPFGIVLFDGSAIRSVGCMAKITEVTRRYDDGRMDIITEGTDRFVIHEIVQEKAYMEARVVFFDDEDEISADDVRDTLEKARQQLKEVTGSNFLPDHRDVFARTSPKNLAFAIASLEGFTPVERQRFLEMTSGMERLKRSVQALFSLNQRARLTKEILRIIGGNGHPPEDLIKNRQKSLYIMISGFVDPPLYSARRCGKERQVGLCFYHIFAKVPWIGIIVLRAGQKRLRVHD